MQYERDDALNQSNFDRSQLQVMEKKAKKTLDNRKKSPGCAIHSPWFLRERRGHQENR